VLSQMDISGGIDLGLRLIAYADAA
jgi:hypothetical protein